MSLAIYEGNFQPKITTEKGKEKPIFSKNTVYVILIGYVQRKS